MSRSSLRIVAAVILGLLGAPLGMHVLLHDLHHEDHHDAGALFYEPAPVHGDHEHPIISSGAPQVPAAPRALIACSSISFARRVEVLRAIAGERNILAFGALRLDVDIGPQSLLSTFLI